MGTFTNRHVLVTAGPTEEPIDPVRFLSNRSSGQLGYAMARIARERGARVTLIAGPTALTPPRHVRHIPVVTARDMLRATLEHGRRASIIIMAAAVADFRVATPSRTKLTSSKTRGRTLRLVPNPDILATLAARRHDGQYLVGFALETSDLLRKARRKLRTKGCDMIIANSAAAIGATQQRAIMMMRDGSHIALPLLAKSALARRILSQVGTMLAEQ
jgi:phosphopantothenoylcysteine decarboxylase / phosphopantothenate---cysteine ligase